MTATEQAKLHYDIHLKVDKLLSYDEINAKIIDDYLDNAISSIERSKQMLKDIEEFYSKKQTLVDLVGDNNDN